MNQKCKKFGKEGSVKYATTPVSKYANMLVCQYATMPLCQYTMIVSMPCFKQEVFLLIKRSFFIDLTEMLLN